MIKNTASVPLTSNTDRLNTTTESIITFSLIVYAVFAPHSIAITQGAFLLGLVAWGVQLASSRDFKQLRTPVDIALFGFFACCVISSFASYDPLVSVKGLKSPAFFFAFYFVTHKIRSLRFASLLTFLLIISCLVNVAYSARQIAIGRGLRIDTIRDDSPLAKKSLRTGDVIMEADGQKIKTEADLSRLIDSNRGPFKIKFQRSEAVGQVIVSRKAIKRSPGDGIERLGITTSPGRNFRVTGFYSHYETYAEVLTLIASLAFGLWIAYPQKRSMMGAFLVTAVLLIAGTVVMTLTRASMVGLALAVLLIAVVSSRRRTMALALLAVMILAPLALVALERSRGISLIDPQEASTAYRLEVWREAFGLIRLHPVLGIGKGSEGKLKDVYGLYDEGRLPPGHFHSTPIQVATWWGLPALALYYACMVIFAVEMWRLARRARTKPQWQVWGIALGGLGALVAFNVNSLVHFNFGDGEVVMMFWLLTGLVFAVRRMSLEAPADESRERIPVALSTEGSDKNRLPAQEVTSESSAQAAAAKRNS